MLNSLGLLKICRGRFAEICTNPQPTPYLVHHSCLHAVGGLCHICESSLVGHETPPCVDLLKYLGIFKRVGDFPKHKTPTRNSHWPHSEKVRCTVIEVEMKGVESSMKISGAGRNRAQMLGKYSSGVDPCTKIRRPAHGSISQKKWFKV